MAIDLINIKRFNKLTYSNFSVFRIHWIFHYVVHIDLYQRKSIFGLICIGDRS